MEIDKEKFLIQLHGFFLNEYLRTRDNKAKDMISYSLKCQKISGILNKFEGMRFPPQIEKQKVSIDGKEIITV